MHDHGGRANERDRTRRIASLSPPVPTQECGHACIRAPHTVNAHAHKGQADGYERTRVPLARGGGRDAVFRASFGPENLPTFLVARANGCTSVRRNFGGCTPVLDEVGRGRRDGLNLVQGSGERDGAIYNRRRMEKRENDERSAEAFRIPARSELGVGEPMVVRLCYSGGAAFSLHLLCSVIPRHTGPIVSVTVYYYYYYWRLYTVGSEEGERTRCFDPHDFSVNVGQLRWTRFVGRYWLPRSGNFSSSRPYFFLWILD